MKCQILMQVGAEGRAGGAASNVSRDHPAARDTDITRRRSAHDRSAASSLGCSAVRPRVERVLRHCSRCDAASAKHLQLRNSQACATAFRHVVIAAARSARWVWAEMRWRWTLKVL